MKNITFQQKMKYRFDNMMAKGPLAVIVWLAAITFLLILIASIVVTAFSILPVDTESMSFPEALWQSMMRAIDPGTVGGDYGWGFRIVMIVVTIGGIFIVSALIGIISAGFDQKLDELRKGRSKVLEEGHTLILGWSPKVFTILSELAIANENQRKPRIVILSDMEKSAMEEEIKGQVADLKNTKVICRSGDPLESNDLEMVGFNSARSIIILPPENDEMHDLFIIKVALALVNNPNRREEPYHIVAEIREEKTLEVLEMIGPEEIAALQLTEVISRLTVQVVHQPGLSVVIEDLLKFDGDEIYFSEIDKLKGKTFAEAQMMFEDSTLIGIQLENLETKLNPPMNQIIGSNDKIIAISEDDDTVIPNGAGSSSGMENVKSELEYNDNRKPVKTLILGYNPKIEIIAREFGNYFPEGSKVDIIVQEELFYLLNDLKDDKLSISRSTGNITSRQFLDSIDFSAIDYVIILSEPNRNIQQADANTLVSLLHVRDIVRKKGFNTNIVSEMLDSKNSDLARISRKNDFIVSEKLVSLLITMISENKYLKPVIEDLLDADGSEIYFKPITNYVKTGVPVDFYQLTEIASQFNQVAMGYRIMSKSNDSNANYGIVVNPKKSAKVTFSEEDVLITLAED